MESTVALEPRTISKELLTNKWMAGKRFYSNEHLTAKTKTYFKGLNQSYSLEGINELKGVDFFKPPSSKVFGV